MKLLRQPEPIKSFEFSLTPEEREEVRRKKRTKNSNSISSKLKRLEEKTILNEFKKFIGNPEDNVTSSRKVKFY